MCMITDMADEDIYKIQKMTVVLGPACNISCRHCIQNKAKNKEWSYKCSVDFIKVLAKWSKIVRLNQRLLFRKPILLFYGGEPLVYYKSIEEIVYSLECYEFDFSAVEIKLFTNGLLLEDNMVDFFNEYGFNVVLSYDGPDEYSIRPRIPSETKLNIWKNIHTKGITACLTKYNQDFLTTRKFLSDKFKINDISIEMIYVNWDMPTEIYAFPSGYFDKQLDRIVAYYNHNRLDKSFLTFTKNYISRITGCYKNITLTADGNILNNRFELEAAENRGCLKEYACSDCEKSKVCLFAGNTNVIDIHCNIGTEFYRAYIKHREELEYLVSRDYEYLLEQNY